MNDLQSLTSYRDYKAAFDAEIKASTEGFVKIGFLLRKAMDTTILYESGYKDVYEFAYNEYHLDKSQVSRFININMKFSQGGYSPNLITEFEGYGPSKLAVMLQLPDGIIEQITPEYTREEITEIKEEVKEELENNTPIQAMTEEDAGEVDILTAAISHYLHEKPEMFREVYGIIQSVLAEDWPHRLAEIFAPSGEALLISRVPGKGKVTIKIREGAPITMYSIILDEKNEFTWDEFAGACEDVATSDFMNEDTVEDAWRDAYGEDFPIKEEPKKIEKEEEKKPEEKPEKKPSRVSVAKPTAKKPEPKVTTCCVAPQNEKPVSVGDMPETEEPEETVAESPTANQEDGSGTENAAVAPAQPDIDSITRMVQAEIEATTGDGNYQLGYRNALKWVMTLLEDKRC